ncbi:MAG: DUF2017 family protein [Acidimicrobiales bacterium]|jgi:hypothetical protein
MIGPFRARFRLHRNGSLDLRITNEERELVGHLTEQLRDLLMGTTASGAVDPAMRRLYPTAHADDADLEDEYQAGKRDELLSRRLENIDTVERTLDAEVLSEVEAATWIKTINDLRLVLGTKLDVIEEDDITDLDPDEEDSYPKAVYHYLGHLLGELIDAVNP